MKTPGVVDLCSAIIKTELLTLPQFRKVGCCNFSRAYIQYIFLFIRIFTNSNVNSFEKITTLSHEMQTLSVKQSQHTWVMNHFGVLVGAFSTIGGWDNCPSPTQPPHELELDLIMGRNPPPTGTFKALPGNLGSWFSVCNLILTQLERRPQKKGKTTSKLFFF